MMIKSGGDKICHLYQMHAQTNCFKYALRAKGIRLRALLFINKLHTYLYKFLYVSFIVSSIFLIHGIPQYFDLLQLRVLLGEVLLVVFLSFRNSNKLLVKVLILKW